MNKLYNYLTNWETKKVDALIVEMRQSLDDKPHNYSVDGFTAGYFRSFILSLGVDENTTFAEALKRPTEDKFTLYISSLVEGTSVSVFDLKDFFQVNYEEAITVFKLVLKKLKKLGWKFSMRDHGLQAWIVEKP